MPGGRPYGGGILVGQSAVKAEECPMSLDHSILITKNDFVRLRPFTGDSSLATSWRRRSWSIIAECRETSSR